LIHAVRTFTSISRLHIIAIAALGTFTFGWLLTDTYLWWIAALCALDWFVVNLLNRAVDLQEDLANDISGADFVQRHRRAVLLVGFTVLAGSVLLAHAYLPSLTPFRIGYHALGMAYNWPLLRGRRRIKQLYFLKNTASAMGFLITLFGYPLAWLFDTAGTFDFPPGVQWGTVAFAVAFFFPLELSYEVIYDLRDEAGDRAAGVATYPVVHGARWAGYLIQALLLLSLAILLVGYGAGMVPWRLAVMGSAPLLQFAAFRYLQAGGRVTTMDCVMLTWFGSLLLVGYHLWEVCGLPGSGA
jgi:4-hydroxybenzoate polyprenyltransferase